MLSRRTTSIKWMFVAGPLIIASVAQAQTDNVSRAMSDELTRSMSLLQLRQMEKPYFLAYRVQDVTQHEASATLGSLTTSSGDPSHNRVLGVELRVGDYSLDNTNFFSMQGIRSGFSGMFGGIEQGSTDDDYTQIRREFWIATDRQYKRALEDLSAKKAALKLRNGGEAVADFSKEAPLNVAAPPLIMSVQSSDMDTLARDLSAVFRSAPGIDRSSVTIKYRNIYTRYVNSEGTSFTRSDPLIKLEVSARTQASDGLPIYDSFTVYGHNVSDLPAKDALLERVRQMSVLMQKLRSASYLENYNGPVLFEGTAAGELLLQQLGPRLAASRPPVSDNPEFERFFNQMLDRLIGSSFQDKIGARILPQFISVRDDPTQIAFNGANLMGSSSIDDDGVKTRGIALVDHGILKTLLNSRTPVRSLPHSSGSRHGWGATPSNLFVNSEKALSDADLRKELLRGAKERDLDYGIVIRRVGGGSEAAFMEMAKQMAQTGSAGSISEIFKLYADGHEEPLRGVHIAELPAESFKEIVATGDTSSLFSDELIPRVGSLFSIGISESGDLPVVTCVSPALLFEEVSLAKTEGPFPAKPISLSPLAEK